jgi:hypothetical protein
MGKKEGGRRSLVVDARNWTVFYYYYYFIFCLGQGNKERILICWHVRLNPPNRKL